MFIQEFFKDLLVSIADAGMHGIAYSYINTASNVIAVLLGIWHGRKLKLQMKNILIPIAVERIMVGRLMTFILWVEAGFSSTGVQNAVVVFPYVPLFAFLVSKLLRCSWKETWDVVMPVPLTMFAGARIACTVAGCCYGYPCSWGIYNVKKGEFLFPIQLLECLAAILILVAVIRREKKNNFVPDGRNVPIILISYGIARFFLEFLHDNKKIAFGCASTSFHCLFMILVGYIALVMIRRSEKREAENLQHGSSLQPPRGE